MGQKEEEHISSGTGLQVRDGRGWRNHRSHLIPLFQADQTWRHSSFIRLEHFCSSENPFFMMVQHLVLGFPSSCCHRNGEPPTLIAIILRTLPDGLAGVEDLWGNQLLNFKLITLSPLTLSLKCNPSTFERFLSSPEEGKKLGISLDSNLPCILRGSEWAELSH